MKKSKKSLAKVIKAAKAVTAAYTQHELGKTRDSYAILAERINDLTDIAYEIEPEPLED